jgi:hypothetical protein
LLVAQIWHDVDELKLALTVIQAGNLPFRSNGDQPYTYITGKMLYEDRGFDMFETKVIHSSNPIYNETFVFHDVDTVDVLRLEILLWDKKQSTQTNNTTNDNDDSDEFIGMIQLPMSEASLDDEPRWYELRDRQARKPSTSNVTFKSSSADKADSFRHMLPSFRSNKSQEQDKSSKDHLARSSNRISTKKRTKTSQSLSASRKHSAIPVPNNVYDKKSLQRASIADPSGGSSLKTNMNSNSHSDDDDDDNDDNDDDDDDMHKHRRGSKRPSILIVQSEKLKRRISQGLLKLFDGQTKHTNDGLTSKLTSSQTTRKLSAHMPSNTDSDDEIESSMTLAIDHSMSMQNKSPRHSIISGVHQDEQQTPTIRSIPLQQTPIGQLMLPYIPSSRHSSISGSRKSSAASYCDSDDDIDRYFTFTEPQPVQKDELYEGSNVQTHTVGPGQVTPRNYENMINDFIHMGQIQLGLIVTKGLLEIDIMCARCLQKVLDDSNHGTNIADIPPDTYVKT